MPARPPAHLFMEYLTGGSFNRNFINTRELLPINSRGEHEYVNPSERNEGPGVTGTRVYNRNTQGLVLCRFIKSGILMVARGRCQENEPVMGFFDCRVNLNMLKGVKGFLIYVGSGDEQLHEI